MAVSSTPAPSAGVSRFSGTLSRNFILLIMLMSLLPLLFVGAATYFRSRQLLRNQASAQLEIITQAQANELEQIAAYSSALMDRMKVDEGLRSAISSLLADQNRLHKRALVAWQFDKYCSISDSESGFHNIGLFLPDGTPLTATDSVWITADYSSSSVLQKLISEDQSFAAFDPEPFYSDQFVIFTSYIIPDINGEPVATLIGSIVSDLPRTSLISSRSFFPNASAFYFTQDNLFLGLSEKGEHLSLIQINEDIEARVLTSLSENQLGGLDEYQSPEGDEILSYIRRIPGLQMGLILEVPIHVIFEQLNILTPINILFFFTAMLLTAAIGYFASTQIVRPLLMVVDHARRFSQGDWSQRVKIRRKDEIGLLGYTFNNMVEQLSDLYQSLELKVNERSRQIMLASEIGQIATSTQNRDEVIKRTVALVTERFDYIYAAIYLVEESGLYAVLKEESEIKPGLKSFAGSRLRLGAESLVGWAAAYNQARILADTENEKFLIQLNQPGVLSEVAVPIATGNLVYGILNVQSKTRANFDSDTVAVLQTLANQISSGLQNIRLLETAQIDLQETSLLYRASRLISQAKDQQEVIQLVVNALKETTFISGLYSIYSDHISIITIFDPKEPGTRIAPEGITIPLKNIPSLFSDSQLILIDDIQKPNDFDHILSFFIRRGCHSAAVIPLYEDNILAKMVVLGARENTELTDTALQPYANLLAVAATTFGRFRILTTLQSRIAELQLLTQFSHELSLYNNPDQLFETLQTLINQAVGSEFELVIALYNRSTEQVEVPYASAMGEIQTIPPFPIGEGLTSYIIRTQKPLLINGDARSKSYELGIRMLGKPAKSWLGIPLTFGGIVIGALILQDTEREDRFNNDHLKVFSLLAPQVAAAVRNMQLLSEVNRIELSYFQEMNLLNTLLENIPDYIYFKDSKGLYLRVSNSYANQFNGAKPEELIGQNDITFLGYQTGAQIFKMEQELMSTGKEQIGIIEMEANETGNEVWRLSSRIPIVTEEGHSSGLLAISRDISNLKKAEERANKSTHQLHIAAEIARDTSATLDLRELLKKAVNMVRERFGFYHASIFLLGADGNFALLEESTGIAGQQMKDSRHKLQVGSQSVIGQVTRDGIPYIINDVDQSSIYYANPLLPDTQAELAIPLKLGDRVLGALDVQSTKQNTFSDHDVAILQILADQLSVAVYNADLFRRAQENIDRHRLLHDITSAASLAITTEDVLVTTVQSLQATMPGDRVSIFLLNSGILELRASAGYETINPRYTQLNLGEGVVGRAAQERQPVFTLIPETEPVDGVFHSQLAVPIIYSRNVVGSLIVESPEFGAYDDYDQEIISTLGNSLGPILYNVRLMAEVRLQVERERRIYEATSRIHRSIDIQTILKTSAAEISKAVGARSAQIEILYGSSEKNGQSDHSTDTKESE